MNHSVMAGSPTMHQKIRAIGGVPTPFASVSPIVRRSNPSTPTRQNTGRPDFIGLAQCGVIQVPHVVRVPQTASYNYGPYHSTNGERRVLTDAELIYDRQYRVPEEMRGDSSGGPIRELAGSPQRGVYHWKDSSPPTEKYGTSVDGGGIMSSYYHSNPTSPVQHSMMNNGGGVGSSGGNGTINMNRAYCQQPQQSAHGGYNSGPNAGSGYGVTNPSLSPNMKKKMYNNMNVGYNGDGSGVGGGHVNDSSRPSPISRRPMSFVRALEMTDSLEMSRGANNRNNSPAGTPASGQLQVSDVGDRASVYDMNYEISV